MLGRFKLVSHDFILETALRQTFGLEDEDAGYHRNDYGDEDGNCKDHRTGLWQMIISTYNTVYLMDEFGL